MSEVVAGSAVQLHPCAVLSGDDPEAVVLDLVQPPLARGRLLGFGGKAGSDEAGRHGPK